MIEERKIFSLRPTEELRIEREIDDTVDPTRLNFIDVNHLVNPNIPEIIRCAVCKGLAHIAVQDESCEQLLCTYCITNTLKTSPKCPVSDCG